MKAHWTFGWVVGALALGLVAGHVIADEGDAGGGGGMQMPTHGEQHKELKKVVGEWTCHSKYWMAPGQPPMEGKDACTCKMILNDWFLEMDYRGDFMGTAWQGRLLAGYDQTRKEHVHVWITGMGGDVSVSRGQKDAKGVLHMYGQDKDHTTGKLRPAESTFEWTDADTFVMKMYWCTADKKRENQMLEITYKRKS